MSGFSTLEYARPDLSRADEQQDLGVLLLGIAQIAVALYLTFWQLQEAGRGYYETQNATLAQRIAYNLWDGKVMLPSWLALSLIVTGSALLAAERRTRWYLCYAIGAIALMLLQVGILGVLDSGSFSDRWVYAGGGAPEPQEWTVFYVEPEWYWQIPILWAIGNPVLILLGVRLVRLMARRFG